MGKNLSCCSERKLKKYGAVTSSKLEHYLVIKKLGAGGQGEVWKYYNKKLKQYVALKRCRVSDFKPQYQLRQKIRFI